MGRSVEVFGIVEVTERIATSGRTRRTTGKRRGDAALFRAWKGRAGAHGSQR
jgi:hypothetical protein